MSIFGTPSLPAAPPPPPNPTSDAAPSIMEQGAAERATLANAQGAGLDGTDVTGGQGAKAPATTKTLLGS